MTVTVELQTNRIVVSPESVYLTSIGEMIQLTASVRDADDMEIPGVGLTLTSEDPAVASVDDQRVVTAHMNGETSIIVTWEDLEARVSVVVSQVADRIVVSKQFVHLPSIGDMVELFATVYDANNVEIQDAELMWSSGDPTVASVDEQDVVTAHMEGETSITVTSGALSASMRITVGQQTSLIVVSPESVDMTAIGETIQLIATAFDMGDREVPGAELTWTSEDPTVATVNNQGVVTAQMNGQTLVTVTWKDVYASVTVTVEQQAHRILAAPQTVHFADAGETKELFVLVIDANDMEIPGAELAWSSENPTVATVDDRGVVTARMEGVTRVTVTSGAISAHVMVIVGSPTTLVVSTKSVRLTAIGETIYPIAMVLDAYNQEIPGADLAWASKDPAVATVNDYGGVTAQMNGQTIVTVTWEDMSDSISVTVAQKADDIVVLPQLVRLSSTEDMIELTASVRDANDVEIPGAELTWTSENPAVASVDEQGVVTGHMLGTTRVTVTSGMVTKSVPVFVGEISSEREILIDFYNATDGPNWRKNTHWLTDQPLEQWYGVDVDSTGRVEEIWLIQNDLNGHIPASLASLSHLKFLNLADNKLSGEIPAALASLSHLEFMRLAQNELSGGIPTGFGNLTLLKTFDLSVNELSGGIPSSLGELSELSAIDLQINKLTGKIPSALGNLENLSYLRLAGNPLSGPIPPSLGQLDKLQRLYLSGNGLTGEIPSEFGGLVSLKELHMSGNSLTGEIPAELGNLEHLVSLNLQDNAGLAGPLPRTFINLTLLSLRLFGTQVCAPRDLEFQEWLLSFHSRFVLNCEAGPDMIPLEALYYLSRGADWTDNTNWRSAEPISRWLGVSVNDAGRVVGLELPMNGLDGVIPSSLSDLSELIRLNLGNNNLTGSIPADLGELENLRELKLHDNPRMSGSLHEELVNLELSTLWLQGTQLCAPGNSNMQTWIQDIADARVADCDPSPTDPMGDRDILVALYNATDGDNWSRNDNWLSDLPLGDWYGIVTGPAGRVHRLEIKSNGLDGTIPSALGSLTELRRMDLYDNSLSGGIPASLGGLSHLEFMFLNGNDLSGSIPSRLGDLSQLRTLSLGGNALTGSIPGQLGNLTNLKALILTGNGISGEIPASIARLSNLTWLSLGNNDLTGEIPSALGHISGLTDLYLYNNGLTGDIPSALGNLVALRNLDLSANDLSGGVPSSFRNLEVLLSLKLSNNADLTGPLPSGLINTSLNILLADGTNLCAPRDQQFLNWLLVVHNRSIPICQLSMEDRETLVAFYHATDGPNWTGISTN